MGKLQKKQQTTDTDLHYDQVEGRPCFVEAVNLFASMFIYLFNFLVVSSFVHACSTPCLWVNFMYLLRQILNRIAVKLETLNCILLICYSVF